MELAVRHYNLFPTRIWQLKLHDMATMFPGWLELVAAMRAANPAPAGRTNRQGWNSADKAVLHKKGFEHLHGAIRSSCQAAFSQMGLQNPVFELESWINIHDRGGFNFLHMHEGSLLSGVFYLQVPPNSGSLAFRDPRPGVVGSWQKGSEPNGYSDVHLHPESGLLVLFPHWLEHYVEPHGNDISRIAISFNAIAR
jgi:uncharacterized protein (TIGR02466 family)